jgi:hypothetical protein
MEGSHPKRDSEFEETSRACQLVKHRAMCNVVQLMRYVCVCPSLYYYHYPTKFGGGGHGPICARLDGDTVCVQMRNLA